MQRRVIDILQIIMYVLLIVFGFIIIYQIVRKIFGGSWSTENIIISLLMLNIGFTFTLALNQIKTSMEFNHLKYQFKCLAKDFKEHVSFY